MNPQDSRYSTLPKHYLSRGRTLSRPGHPSQQHGSPCRFRSGNPPHFSIAITDQAQLGHTERVQACLTASIRIQSSFARQVSIDECTKICPRSCRLGYVCRKGACVDPCLAIKCRTGYRCFEGQCRKVTGCGQKCDYSIWICAVGTSCINGKCTGPTVGENSTCGGSNCNKCKSGTRCYQGKCRKVMGCGEPCAYPKWICGIGATGKHKPCQCTDYDPCGDRRIDCKSR